MVCIYLVLDYTELQEFGNNKPAIINRKGCASDSDSTKSFMNSSERAKDNF